MNNTIVPIVPAICHACPRAITRRTAPKSNWVYSLLDSKHWVCLPVEIDEESIVIVRGESTVPTTCTRKTMHELALLGVVIP